MGEQLKPFSVIKLTIAGALLLSIGGYDFGLLPSPKISLGVLLALLVVDKARAAFAAQGRAETLAAWREWARRHRFALGLAAITAMALALRLFGATRDLGHVALGIDENRLNASVLHLFRTGEIDYRTVEHYPGIHYWTLTGTYLVAYLWGLMTDVADTLARMPRTHFVAFGRAVSAVQSAATVLLAGLLGRRLAGPRAGLLAAALLAIAPLSVSLGRQLRNDAAQTMLIVAAVVVALGLLRGTFRSWEPALAGALAGLAAGVKYTGVFALLPVGLAAALSVDKDRRWQALALIACGFLPAALLSNHFVWADLPNLVDQLSDQILITGQDHWAAQDNPAAYHIRILAQRVVGWPLLLLAAAAVAYHLAAGRARWWVFSVYPLVYVWFVAQRPSQLPRWVYPAAPFAAVAACAGLVALIDWIGARVAAALSGGRTADDRRHAEPPDPPDRRWLAGRRRFAPAVALLVLVFFAPMLWATAMNLNRQLSPPTFTLAERWIVDNAAPGDRILLQNNWLQLDGQVFALDRRRSLEEALTGGRYALAANDWIVVHEALLQHDGLANLRLVEKVSVDPTFFGNQGPDFAIYAPRPIEPASLPLRVSLNDPGADEYLDHRWPPSSSRADGRPLPADGASLFLPPLGSDGEWLDILVAPTTDAVALEATTGSTDLPLERGREDGGLVFSSELPLGLVGPGVIEVTLRPAPEGPPMHILGFRLRSE